MSVKEVLKQLIETPSVTGSEESITATLVELLKQFGFEIKISEVLPGRNNILAYKNNSSDSKCILFYGHQDTVAPSQHWQEPFIAKTDGDKVIGLGSYDMKGGIAAFLEATKDASKYVKVFLAVDEEANSLGAWHAIENEKEFFKDVELVISAEPNFGLGISGITQGRTGRVIYKVEINGKAEHIAKYTQAKDAIKIAGNFITRLYSSWKNIVESNQSVIQIRSVQAKANGMSVCDKVSLEIEAILGFPDTNSTILTKLQEFAKSIDSEITTQFLERNTPYLEGYFFEHVPHHEQLASIIKHATGQEMSLHTRSSVGDDNVLASLKIPVITWGPDGGNAHTDQEWVSLSSLETLARMYRELVK